MRFSAIDYEKKLWGNEESILNFDDYSSSLEITQKAFKNAKGKVLDAGCGGGVFTYLLQKYLPDLKFYGCDNSKNCIESAREKYPGINFVKTDLTKKLPYPDNFFSAVVAKHVFEHLADPDKAAGQIHRVLKTGGIFLSILPLEGSRYSLTTYLRKNPWFDRNRIKYLGHLQKFNSESYLELLKKVGFRSKVIGWNGYLLYQVIDCLYYILLEIFGLPADFLLERQITRQKTGLIKKIGFILKRWVYFLYGVEIRLFGKFPGYIILVKSYKI